MTYRIHEVALRVGIEETRIIHFVREEWLVPVRADQEALEFDEEDIARARLIHELREEMGVNDEAIPIILNLLDQVCGLQRALRQRKSG